MSTFVLKLNCELHLNGAPPRPTDAEQWEGQRVTLPARVSGAAGGAVATGDKLIIWTHEDPDYGKGQGLTATATAGEIINGPGGQQAVMLNVVLIKPHVRLNDLPAGPTGSEILDNMRSYRLLRTISIEGDQEAEFWRVIERRESDRLNRIAAYTSSLPKSAAEQALENDGPNIAQEYERQFAVVETRPQQARFREALIKLYGARCLICNSRVGAVLQAAHIVPFSEGSEFRNDPKNGLLLRADLHLLFDAAMLAVHPTRRTVVISPNLRGTIYEKFEGRTVEHKALPIYVARHFEEWQSRLAALGSDI